MDNTPEIIEAIQISLDVTNFLTNTYRCFEAIVLCKECLVLLGNKALENEKQLSKALNSGIHDVMFNAYCQIYGYTSAVQYGDKKEIAKTYREIAAMSYKKFEYITAKEFCKRALAIDIQIGDKEREGEDCSNLGVLFQSVSKYSKAKNYHEKALVIAVEVGDSKGEASISGNLGRVYSAVGEYVEAKKYFEKALAICIEIEDRKGTAWSYGNLGNVFGSLGEYDTAKGYHEKALAGNIEIGDREGVAASNSDLGHFFHSFREYDKAKEYYEQSLAICQEIGDREGEAVNCSGLGHVCLDLGKYAMAEKALEKALSIARDISRGDIEFKCSSSLTFVKLSQGKFEEALSSLLQSLTKGEDLRCFLADNDQFKTSSSDFLAFPYLMLSAMYCAAGGPNEALFVLELGRARALAALMATKYSAKNQISPNLESWVGIANIAKKESNCTCLYLFLTQQHIFLWILKTSGVIYFRENKCIVGDGVIKNLGDFFSKRFRSFGILSEEECEDRSLNDIQPNVNSSQEESLAALRLMEEDDVEKSQEPEPSLSLCYKMLIAPVADLLEEREIIIVPDRSLYQVPFSALHDASGKYLSDTFRIRIVPSLTTLKLIQDSPADYHSQTGALIVGDPKVGQVLHKGRHKNMSRLSWAKKEAEMIGRLLGVQPLLAEHATKQAVLKGIHSASLIHFAAHGNAERGEIALAPQGVTSTIPEEEDYLLTMSDISQVQLRATLVVLSCCHSGRGQTSTEGVVGIARAFLGSGARSVLVALWAIEDTATEQFMRRFYEHLVRGESASESLHEAMKWMRDNGYSHVMQWAPFVLIGDNVTLEFRK